MMIGQELYESHEGHKNVTRTPWTDLRPQWQANWERNARLKTAKQVARIRNRMEVRDAGLLRMDALG